MDKNYHLPGTADDFIKANMKLAQKVAWKFIPYVLQSEDIKLDKDDLVSIAYIGLIKAYEMFDPSRGVGADGGGIKFSTYAVPTIKGYIGKAIRDKGNIIRKSRGGETIPCDSLDIPIGDEEGKVLTLADKVLVETHEIENKVIINDFLSHTNPQLQQIYKMWDRGMNQKEISKKMGISQVRVSKLQAKLIDLAREYGKGGKEVSVLKENAVKMETAPFEIPNIQQSYEEVKTFLDGREGMPLPLEDNKVGDCLGEQTDSHYSSNSAIGRLAEVEPPWTPEIAEEPIRITGDIKIVQMLNPEWDEPQGEKEPDLIEEQLLYIQQQIAGLREMYMKQAEKVFEERLAQAMRGMAG
jgi:RNA polymerase sigma factor (sigma-70 family)